MVDIMTTRAQQLDKIERDGWYRKGLNGPISMVSTVKDKQNQRFTFNNFTKGKK